jgi:hypothetical protein
VSWRCGATPALPRPKAGAARRSSRPSVFCATPSLRPRNLRRT